jgi:hypothetical protein
LLVKVALLRLKIDKWTPIDLIWPHGNCYGLTHGVNKKGVAIPGVRAHSEFTAIKFRYFLVSVLAAPVSKIFNPRAIGGFL